MDFAIGFQKLAIQFPPFVMAVVFHEVAHGFVALKWGDKTAQQQGRLTFNPIPHMDPMGTVLFPILGMISGMGVLFGWARPVPINPNRFRKYRPGLFWVSLAGPGMNFILANVSALVYVALLTWMPRQFYLFEPLAGMAVVSVQLNYWLGIFNLLPLPPLDGSKIVESFLPYHAAQKFEVLNQYSFFILMALLMSGALSILAYPIGFFTNMTLFFAERLFSVFGF
ncbi:MAG: site-2 protease family protein [Bdellovibrionota bacterium]